jgi:oligoendopeptidase F
VTIKIKKSHKGLLHRDLGVATGKKIPEAKLATAKKSKDPAVRKRATFAESAKHWNKK